VDGEVPAEIHTHTPTTTLLHTYLHTQTILYTEPFACAEKVRGEITSLLFLMNSWC
jgi:hypothetical protein